MQGRIKEEIDMPIEIGRKQTIEEITNGRIKKKGKEEMAPTAPKGRVEEEETAARKGGRARK